MTPIEAAKVEACTELDALAQRVKPDAKLRALTIRIEFDDATGMPRARAVSSTLNVPRAFTSKSIRGSVTEIVTATCAARSSA